MSKYKFNPLDHGYEPISKFPELAYRFPMKDDIWFVKVVCYGNYDGIVYWYSAISLSVGLSQDDRIKILASVHDFRRDATYNAQGRMRDNVVYCGLITSDEYARQLLVHLFGTLYNESVETDGIERYSQNLNEKMRQELLS